VRSAALSKKMHDSAMPCVCRGTQLQSRCSSVVGASMAKVKHKQPKMPLMPRFEWRLREAARRAGITTYVEFARRLREIGVNISNTQAWRYFSHRPGAIPLDKLEAFCYLLDCELTDLMVRTIEKHRTRDRYGLLEPPLVEF
jgi:DNA-binding Xre family transcriptional regulator